MSWRQPCYCLICLCLPISKRGAFETRCRLCSKWWRPNRPKAQLLDVGGQPQRNVSSRPEMRGRCRFIKEHPLEEGKPCPSKSTSSIINSDTTLDMTSTSIAAVGMGTQRNAATVPTAVDERQQQGPNGSRTTGPSSLQRSNPQHAAAQFVPTPDQHCQIQW